MTGLANRRSVMTLYSDATDPIGHGVRIVLAEKDINVEVNFVDGDNRPEDLNDLNPYDSVLTLIDRELVIYEAQIMMEYVDERYPHPPLMPVDPVSRATNRQFRYRVIRDLYGVLSDLSGENKFAAANARKTIRDNLLAIAPIFSQHAYFMSDEYSLVDCCLSPLLWRLPLYGVKLTAQAKPIVKYAEKIFAREGFRASLSPFERDIGE
ncbi:MAG: glutathione S-transferase N-terminal domain-containing protein [Proteobacteria bacterium]|nr:glutathione S-transferase N-terminal domain-containing protein [Pseudomonadota bacterium]